MQINPITTRQIVKGEDLNHHGTLFAARTAQWFVEAGLIATAVCIPANNIVCLKIHSMMFSRPVNLGEIVVFTSKVVYTGKTSLITHIKMCIGESEIVNGFITFVNVDEAGKAFPHGLEIQAVDDEDLALQEQAKELYRKHD